MKRQKQPYRHKQEIMYLMLDAARSPKTRTRLLYESMTSWEQTNEYAKELINYGLLSYNITEGTYITTEKGLKFVQLYSSLKEKLE